MGWRRARHQCSRPLFWSWFAEGRVWDCPECKATWVVCRGLLGKAFVLVKAGGQ